MTTMSTQPTRRSWSGEDGIALVLAMFMVLIVSLLGASMATLGRTETMASLNYKTMSQARYAAESGLHSAANYLIYVYEPPGADAGDPLVGVYDTTKSPVRLMANDEPVVLTTVDGEMSNYPIDAKIEAFKDDSQGELLMSNSKTTYTATATLLSMRRFPDAYSGADVTIQTWQITGVGTIPGAGAAAVQVSAIIETQAVPAFRYAAFATKNGCASLMFAGGGSTDSYDSSELVAGVATLSPSGGDVGTNGNLDENGASGTVVNGTLSTPRGGVGSCTANNVTALTISGKATVTEGLVRLPQEVKMKTPAAISPAPPLTDVEFKKTGGCPDPSLALYCTAGATAAGLTPLMISPPTPQTVVSMGDVNLSAGAQLTLQAGVYEINSITALGNAALVIDSTDGPVIIRVAGKADDGSELTIPINLSGGSIANPSLNPQNLQWIYGGTGEVKVNGGNDTATLIYAPNATVSLLGSSHFYGAVVGGIVKDTGGAKVHYDRQLGGWALTEGNPTMTSFTWSSTK